LYVGARCGEIRFDAVLLVMTDEVWISDARLGEARQVTAVQVCFVEARLGRAWFDQARAGKSSR